MFEYWSFFGAWDLVLGASGALAARLARGGTYFLLFPFPICETRRRPLLIEACSH
jgi:hypothetical protein